MPKLEMSINIVGKKVIVVSEGITYSRNIALAADRNELKEKVLAYNKRNSIKASKEILSYMETPKKEKKEAVKAGLKKAPKAKPAQAEKPVAPVIKEKVVKAKEEDIKKPEPTVAPKSYYGRREH